MRQFAAAVFALSLSAAPRRAEALGKYSKHGAPEVIEQLATLDEFRARDAEGFDYLLHRAHLNTLPAGKASRDAGIAADTVEPTLILLMANSNYKEVLFNFIWILETRYSALNYGIACMDEEIYEFLQEKKIQCYRMVTAEGDGSATRRTVRMELILNLLRAGVNVIQNDVDAVWRSDLRLEIQQADITAQRDQSPKELLVEWGSTFCTGSLFIRSCGKTIRFMEHALDKATVHAFLDQLKFNMDLENNTNGGITWTSPIESRYYRTQHSTGDVSRGVCRGWEDMTVALLPQDPFRRQCTGDTPFMRTAKIIHCNRAKEGADKKAMLLEFDAWELPHQYDLCMKENGEDNMYSQRCADKLQRSYEAVQVDWCLDLVDAFKIRPLSHGSHYKGPLFGEELLLFAQYDSPWGMGADDPRKKAVFRNTGLGSARGCDAIVGALEK